MKDPENVERLFGVLTATFMDGHRPDPQSVPAESLRPGLAESFAKDLNRLTRADIHELVWGITTHQYNSFGALRYYLPFLMRRYWTGKDIDGGALECTLLGWYFHFSREERGLLSQILVSAWERHVGTWDTQACFLLFWCDDLSPLMGPFLEAEKYLQNVDTPEESNLMRLHRLWADVQCSSDPLGTIRDGLYFSVDDDVLGRIIDEKGPQILTFLRTVGWI